MTETTAFPFSPLTADAPAAEAGPDRRRLAVVLGAGLAGVALVGSTVFFLTGNGDGVEDSAFLPVAGASGDTLAAAPAAEPLTVPVANTESFARNPFEPKYVAPAPPAPAQADPGALPPTVIGSDGVSVPLPDVLPGSPPLVDPGRPAEPAPAPAPAPREYRLVLTGVTTDGGVPTAQFTIDGAVSAVKATEIFGPQRQLLLRSLQQGPKDGQWTATLQVGDARPIDVVTGEAVYVQ